MLLRLPRIQLIKGKHRQLNRCIENPFVKFFSKNGLSPRNVLTWEPSLLINNYGITSKRKIELLWRQNVFSKNIESKEWLRVNHLEVY